MHSDYVTRIGQIVTIEPSRTRELLASNLGKYIYLVYFFFC
jgi:hypothetical protein